MKENNNFLTTISNLHPRNNAINILKDIQNIHFFVYTIGKTGTSTLSLSLQKMMNNRNVYEHVVHCHTETCWKRIFNIDFEFDLMSLIKNQQKKPIVFQLSRDPVKRLISEYFHNIRNVKKNSTYAELVAFLEKNKKRINSSYYQTKFDYNFNDLHYNYDDKCCVIEKEDYILFFMKMEDFNNHLKPNLIKYLNKYGYDFHHFRQIITNQTKNTYHKNTLNEIEKKGIPKEICQSIFNNNRDEVNFFFSPEEIQQMEITYDIKIDK
jgi:hypothetical protein